MGEKQKDEQEIPSFIKDILLIAAIAAAVSVVIAVITAGALAHQLVQYHYPDPPSSSCRN